MKAVRNNLKLISVTLLMITAVISLFSISNVQNSQISQTPKLNASALSTGEVGWEYAEDTRIYRHIEKFNFPNHDNQNGTDTRDRPRNPDQVGGYQKYYNFGYETDFHLRAVSYSFSLQSQFFSLPAGTYTVSHLAENNAYITGFKAKIKANAGYHWRSYNLGKDWWAVDYWGEWNKNEGWEDYDTLKTQEFNFNSSISLGVTPSASYGNQSITIDNSFWTNLRFDITKENDSLGVKIYTYGGKIIGRTTKGGGREFNLPSVNISGEYSEVQNVILDPETGNTNTYPIESQNRQSTLYSHFPNQLTYGNAGINEQITIPAESETKKVIKLYYGADTSAYFNYLNSVYRSDYGNKYTYAGSNINIPATTNKNYYYYYFNTIKIKLESAEFYLAFDVIGDLSDTAVSVKNLVENEKISNVEIITTKDFKFQVYQDTSARYTLRRNDLRWYESEPSKGSSEAKDLSKARELNDGQSFSFNQQNSQYTNSKWVDASENLTVKLKNEFWDNLSIKVANGNLKIDFKNSINENMNSTNTFQTKALLDIVDGVENDIAYVSVDTTHNNAKTKYKYVNEGWVYQSNVTLDNLQNYLSYSIKYPNPDQNANPNNLYLTETKVPDWVEGENTNFSTDGSNIVPSKKVFNKTRLITIDNSIPQIVETENERYKARMKLVLNTKYLGQVLSGYDIFKVQTRLTINEYAQKIANWSLRYDAFLTDYDHDIWNFIYDALCKGKLIDITNSQIIDYIIPGTNKKLFAYEDMIYYDVNYFLDNCTANNWVEFRNAINNLDCPFKNYINWTYGENKDLLADVEDLFTQENTFNINYSFSTNYNSLILSQLSSITTTLSDFLNEGIMIETTGDITGNNPATLRINNIGLTNNFDSYEASSKVFGMVRRSEEVKNATGLNFVIYQNNGNWYDPEDHTDPNNPEYIPPNGSGGTGGNTGGGTNQPGGSTKPPADATSLFGIPGTNGAMPIILIILFIAAVGGGIYIFTKKRRRGGAFVK